MGLAPMAVSPSLQRGGIGSELVKTGLLRCTESDVGAVAVLGHPQYYPRFGFRPASQWGIKSEYEVPEEVFMMMELSPGYLQGYQGIVRYDAVFADI
jgi:putative acetyltransferase